MHRSDDRALAELASSQFGLFTIDQARQLGFTESVRRTRVRNGRWSVIHPGVLVVTGAPQSAHRAHLAACLLGGNGTVVARCAAAWVWDLPGGRSGPVEVVSKRWRRVRRNRIVAHETIDLSPSDRSSRYGIPVTSPCRTIMDRCAVLHPHRAGAMLDDARRRGLVTLGAFARRVDELAASGRNGIALARDLAAERGAPPASVFESHLLLVLREAGLPPPLVGHRLTIRGDAYVLDFAYPDRRVCIEADSEAFHLDLDAFRRDRRRQNALVLAGWTVLRFTWDDLRHRPGVIATQVRAAASGAA